MQAFMRCCRHAFVTLACLSALGPSLAQAQGVNGTLGLFFDDRGQNCAALLATGRTATLWVLLIPEGDTRGGIAGAEFRIDTSGAPGYVFSKEEVILPNGFYLGGPAVGTGINIVTTSGCERGVPIPLMKLQVQNVGGGRDGVIRIDHKDPPSNRDFACPLVLLCDDPVYTKVCMEVGPKNIAVLNPSGSIPCGITAESSEWGAVKELYR